jgi:hypothetical protein
MHFERTLVILSKTSCSFPFLSPPLNLKLEHSVSLTFRNGLRIAIEESALQIVCLAIFIHQDHNLLPGPIAPARCIGRLVLDHVAYLMTWHLMQLQMASPNGWDEDAMAQLREVHVPLLVVFLAGHGVDG